MHQMKKKIYIYIYNSKIKLIKTKKQYEVKRKFLDIKKKIMQSF